MALFGKKTSDGSTSSTATSTASAPKKSRGFGRKKDDATPPPVPGAAGGTEDFSDFSQLGDATGVAPPPVPAAQGARRSGRARSIKNGTALGINIGSDSIKAVELQAKGGEVAITALGIIPTPAESINNGVITSIAALQHAVRDLCKQAGIKSKRAVLSVAGTGALVVRVIEVPKMTDAELADNMQVDADRYIPFPPSEVIMDFKALRELPTDPDAANMDVLLAAAQREIIDSHVKVIEEAKLDPRAIEVEPLAAARALTFRGSAGLNGDVNYSDVSAIINIGATGTEISVLRGDILVFTRTVPNGGNSLTQQLVDYLGLPWHDAERVKLDWGDALPPHIVAGQAPTAPQAADAHDDWSEFSAFDDQTAAAPDTTAPADTSTILDLDYDPNAPNPAASNPAASSNTPTSDDPFDLDFFNQGPSNDEPKSQHGQKEEDKPAFDFSGFQFSDEEEATPTETPAAEAVTEPTAEVNETSPGAQASPVEASSAQASSAQASSEAAAPESSSAFDFAFPATDTEPAEDQPGTPAIDFNLADFNLADEPPAGESSSTTTTGILPDDEAEDTGSASEAAPFSLDKPAQADALVTDTPVADASSSTPDDANATSAWSLDKFDIPSTSDAPPASAAPAASDTTATPAGTTGDDFDLDSFFTDVPDPTSDTTDSTDAALAGAGLAGAGVAGAAAASVADANAADANAAGAGLAGADAAGPNDFGVDFGGFNDDLSSFGAGLSGATPGVDAATVHSILHPVIDELSGEIRRSLEYHASRYPDAVVQHITLIGGGARLKNIDAYFTQTLGIPTTIGNPLTNIAVRTPSLPDGYAAQNAPIFTVALGLALRDLII